MDCNAPSAWDLWEHIGKIAPVATACIALLAATVAVFALRAQVSIARKRAAIDFFVKTEMDGPMLAAFQRYERGLDTAKSHETIDEFIKNCPDEYDHVHSYLDTIEFVCIGINHKVYDQRVCYGFWEGVLKRATTDGMPIIRRVQGSDTSIYVHLLRVSKRWNGPHRIWQRWRGA